MKNENVSDQCPPNLANRRQRIIKNNTQYFLNISTVRYKSVYTRIVEIRLKKTQKHIKCSAGKHL